jgi:hypothetical protein
MGKIASESVSPFVKMKLTPFSNNKEEEKEKRNSTLTLLKKKKKKKTTKKGKNCQRRVKWEKL